MPTWDNFAVTWDDPSTWDDDPPAFTLTEDSAWPPRVIVEVTGLGIGDTVTLYRVVSGVRTVVRGVDGATLTDPSLVVYDAEEPFGVPYSYSIEVDGEAGVSSDPITVVLPGGKVALSDALTGLAVEVVITAWPTRSNSRTASRFDLPGRTVIVSATRAGTDDQIEFLTETETARQQMIALLEGATSNIILMRQPGGYAGVDGYYYVTADTEARAAQSGKLERRLWTLTTTECAGWAPDLMAQGWTLADIAAVYAGRTLGDIAADFDTLLDIAVHDWGAP